jgi:UDP-N-acetylglucosamine 2-epimerase
VVALFIASFNRASNGAVAMLEQELKKKGMIVNLPEYATHILAVGDRTETYDCVLEQYRKNIPIIHLWAGESDALWSTHDEVYRHSMTLMSFMQLCTNEESKKRVEALCKSVGKEPNAYVIGNVMLDDMTLDESELPKSKYILVLYNPIPTSENETRKDLNSIQTFLQKNNDYKVIWIEPNGDKNSDMIMPFVTHKSFPRKKFLALIKHCSFFVTNSSCQYYEAPFLIEKLKIFPVGKRNVNRTSKDADMGMVGAKDRIIDLLEKIK